MTPSASLAVVEVFAGPIPWSFGGQVLVLGHARALQSAGYRVVIASWGFGQGDLPAGILRVDVACWGSHTAKTGPHLGRIKHDLALLVGLIRQLKSDPVDILHAQHVEGLLVAWLARAWTASAAPIVWTPHTRLGDELVDYLPDAWEQTPLAYVAARLGRFADDHLPRLADAVVGLSETGCREARALGLDRVSWLHPGVDVGQLAGGDAQVFRSHYGLGSRPIVLYTGNADRYQRLDRLAKLASDLPDFAVVLLTHGAADAALMQLGHAPVVVVSHADTQTLRNALAAAAVGIVPRACCAGFPMKILNHLAAGHPVVIDASLGIALPGVVVVEGGDDPDFATAIRTLLDDPSGLARRAKQAQAFTQTSASWEAVGAWFHAQLADWFSDGTAPNLKRERAGKFGERGYRGRFKKLWAKQTTKRPK